MKKALIILGIIGTLGVGAAALPEKSVDKPVDKPVEKTLVERLEGKTSAEKANLKGQEIAQKARTTTHNRGAVRIEIVEIRPIDKGVEVFVRAWKNGRQIGFGKDGTVDIERFRIYNPPVLVPDKNGEIVKEWTEPSTGKHMVDKYRVDPEEALLQVIEHNLAVMKNIHDDAKIIAGKRGNTTSTFYPDAHTETTTVDGYARRDTTSETFTQITDGAGTVHEDDVAYIALQMSTSGTTDEYDRLGRTFTLFDTSSIGSDTVTAATYSLFFYSGGTADELGSQAVSVVETTIASDTDVVDSDYQGTDANKTKLASDQTITGITESQYTDFTLNASGEAAINGSGITYLGAKFAADVDDSAPTWSATSEVFANHRAADQTGTSEDPKLVVEHGAAAAPAATPQSVIWFD